MLKQLALVVLILPLTASAFASSDDAWAEFAMDVELACLAATAGVFAEPAVTVDPFGSENYGLAIVSGTFPSGGDGAIVCVFDKQTHAVEVGGELPIAITPVDPPN